MISVSVDTAKITKLKQKFEKYGPYAVGKGLQAANDYLNSPDFKSTMYPEIPKDTPFVWSSQAQRKKFFATNGFGGGIPYVRTMQLKDQGKFVINNQNYWISYVNGVPYAQWVISPSSQIIGHKKRKWLVINKFVTNNSTKVVNTFKPAVLKAWEEMDAFMYGGGAGL